MSINCCIFWRDKNLLEGKTWAKSWTTFCWSCVSAKRSHQNRGWKSRFLRQRAEFGGGNMVETEGWLNLDAGNMGCHRYYIPSWKISIYQGSLFKKKSPHWKWIPIFFKTQWRHSKMLGVAGPQVFSIQTIFNSTSPRGDSWKPCHLTPSPSESVRPMRALFATWFRTLMLVRVPTSIRDTWKTSLNYHWLENDPPTQISITIGGTKLKSTKTGAFDYFAFKGW